MCITVGLALAGVLAQHWHSGWLLLLDWAPGPRSTIGDGLGLPTGPTVNALASGARWISPSFAGWGVVSAGILASYAGGVRLARTWRGAGRARMSWWAAIVSGCVAAANPFIAARVYTGQIGVIWGYAAMWWLVAEVADGLDRPALQGSIRPAMLCALAAACSLQLFVVGTIVATVFALVQSRQLGRAHAARRWLIFVGISSVLTAAWVVPELVATNAYLGSAGGRSAVRVFTSGGSVWTLGLRVAGGAGFWRPLPAGALTVLGVFVAAAWELTVLGGWRHGHGWSRDLRHALLACAVVGITIAYLGRGPTAGPWAWLITTVRPVGLLRETGKLTMLVILAPACGAAVVTACFLIPAAAASAQSYDSPDGAAVVTDSSLSAHGSFTVSGDGFMAGSTVDVVFHSTPVNVGSLTATSTGSVRGTFAVPDGLANGNHTILLNGVDATGASRTLSVAVTVGVVTASSPSSLAFTGAATLGLIVVGGLCVAAGVMVLQLRRRRAGLIV